MCLLLDEHDLLLHRHFLLLQQFPIFNFGNSFHYLPCQNKWLIYLIFLIVIKHFVQNVSFRDVVANLLLLHLMISVVCGKLLVLIVVPGFWWIIKFRGCKIWQQLIVPIVQQKKNNKRFTQTLKNSTTFINV